MKPTAFILNVIDHTKGGSHWISIYVNKSEEGFYFEPVIRLCEKDLKRIRISMVEWKNLENVFGNIDNYSNGGCD